MMMEFKDLEHLSIPFQLIKEATENFTTIIGKGGYGPVYKGQISLSGQRELTTVAIKRLDTKISGQGLKEFLTEIRLLTRYKHPNLISLVGFCNQGPEKVLIYEYAHRGSLDKYLRTSPDSACQLTWMQRLNICVDAARGLDHLHNHVAEHERVIHRDIKSANVLLDNNWKAMIADFGLSRIGRANENDTFIYTNVVGTAGYVDPAYKCSGILTKESDVYSFGVVLFEVLCGRSCFYMDGVSKQRLLPQLAQTFYREETLDRIIDPILSEYMSTDSMKKFSRIAYQCLLGDRQGRPSMDVVLQQLEKALKLQEDVDKTRLSLTNRKMKEKLDSHVAYTNRDDLYTNPSKEVLVNKENVLLYKGDEGNIHEIQSEVTLSRRNWIPICLPESWDEDVPKSNQAELRVLSNLVATSHCRGAQDKSFWENVGLTVNILLRKKSDYNDLLIQSFADIKKSLDNNGSRFGDSYIRHWVAMMELYKEVTRCAEDASGRLVYESVACIRIIITSVAQGLKASMAIKHVEMVTYTLRDILDNAKAFGVIDDLLSCIVTCGTGLMSGSSNLLRAACEASEAIWSLIDAFELQCTQENAPVFPLSSMHSHSLDRINIKRDKCESFIGKDYEEIVETVTQAFLGSEAVRLAMFYCLRQRLVTSWSSVIKIILRCCLHNDSVARVLCGLFSSSSIVGGGGENTIISEVFSIINLCASFDRDPQQQDTNNLKSKVSDPSDLVLHACLLIASVAQSIDTAVIMLTSSPETQQSRLSDLAHYCSMCNGLQNLHPHSMSAMLALAYMCYLEMNESVATSIREIVVPLIPPSATLCYYLKMSKTDPQGTGKNMLSYWHGIRDGCTLLLCIRLYWGGPLAFQDMGGSEILKCLINLLGNKYPDEIGLSPLGVQWTMISLMQCFQGGISVFRQVLFSSEHVQILCDLISDIHLKLLRCWGGPGGGKNAVTITIDVVVYLLGFPFVTSEESVLDMGKYIQIILEVGLPGQIINCLEHLESKNTEDVLLLLSKMVEHRSLAVELVGKGLLNPNLMKRLLDDSSPTQVKIKVLEIVSEVAEMDEEFFKYIDGADILPHLKAFLTHEDPILRSWTLQAIGEMCSHSSYFYSLLAKHNVIGLLGSRLMDKDTNAVYAIFWTACYSDLFHEELRICIPQLAEMLISADTTDIEKEYISGCLLSLSGHSDKLIEDMISKGAVNALLKVVADYSIVALEPSRTYVINESLLQTSLMALAEMYNHQPCRKIIRSSDVYQVIKKLRHLPEEDIANVAIDIVGY
ncbi:serine/threonine-protein kinase TIO-like isoform X1 [Rutidosis leptorrhynchoides]|uniref:serine/threonine-protein kinase TIO-like isoform X1 n=1 Tax=Rutidosis leptorrhynchoides TaxID=125765 RepID=UPI003A997B2D